MSAGYATRTLKADQEAAGNTILRLRDRITRENRDFNSEEKSEWDAANKAFDAAGETIKRIEAAEQERGMSVGGEYVPMYNKSRDRFKPGLGDTVPGERQAGRESDADIAVAAWAGAGRRGRPLTAQQWEACRATGVNPNANEIDIPLFSNRELRAQGVGSGAIGGFTVPTTLRHELEVALKTYGPVRRVAHVFRTDDGGTYNWPMTNDTGNVGAILAENTTVGSAVDVTFANTAFSSYKYSSGLVLVSNELAEDTVLDLGAEIGRLLGERLARGQDAHMTTGTGSSQPQGVVTAATLGKTTASATAITSDEVIELYHALEASYRDDPSCAFMAHDNIISYIRRLKTTTNEYLWQPGMQDGSPDRLFGKPIVTNNSMASAITTGQKTMLIGAFNCYQVRDVRGVRLVKLVERYASEDQVAYIAFLRTDAKLVNAGQNPLRFLAQL